MVPVPVSAVLVPIAYCPFLHKWYRYRLERYQYRCPNFIYIYIYISFLYFYKLGTVVPMYKYILFECFPSRISLHTHLSPCSYSAQLTVFTELTVVFPSFDTFTLTMGSTVFLVVLVPRGRTELATQGLTWVQGVNQNDFTNCNTEIMALNHFLVMLVFLREYDACS